MLYIYIYIYMSACMHMFRHRHCCEHKIMHVCARRCNKYTAHVPDRPVESVILSLILADVCLCSVCPG